LTAFIFSIFFYWIYPPLAISAGLMPLIPAAHNEYNAWTYGTTTGPFLHKLFANYGIIVAIAVWLLFAHRRQLASSFRAAFSGERAGSPSSDELSPKIVWMGFLIFLVLYIVWMAIFGAAVLPIIVGVIFWFIYYVGGTVGFGRATWMGDVHDPGYWIMPMIYDAGVAQGAFGPAPSQAKFDTYFLLRAGPIPGGNYYTNQTDFQVGGVLGSYKLLEERGVSRKDIFKTQWITWILAIPIGIITFIWYIFTWGHNNLSIVIYGGWDAGTNNALLQGTYIVGNGQHWIWMAIGSVVGILMYVLRMRFAWFFLDPVGIIFAEGWVTIIIEAGLCWTIKYLVIKIGGPKAYDKYVIPAAVGYLAGLGVTGTLTALFVGFPAAIGRMIGG
jgi:hypothetical protein